MSRIHTKPNPGGYVNIKLGGIYLNGSDPVTVEGIHAKIVEAMKTGKPIYVSDFYTEDTASPSSPVLMCERDDEGSFSGYFDNRSNGFYYLYITVDDGVLLSFVQYSS